MSIAISSVICVPREDNVFPGTWPDCLECHGSGHPNKEKPSIPCQTCQVKSAAISRSLGDLVDFQYYGRPKNRVTHFPSPGQLVQSAWRDITWAEIFSGNGVSAGTWPDCTGCLGLGSERYECSWDGHRSDHDWRDCGICQHKTRQFHIEHPNEKDILVRSHAVELKEAQSRHQAEILELRARHQAELDAISY